MDDELAVLNELLFNDKNQISDVFIENEAKEYFGFDFRVNQLQFKYRKAKTTPKKVGLFVTLWRRNLEKITEPFHKNDSFDFYLIAVNENEKQGLFIFPKNELIKQKILSTLTKEGKRGFRVYPSWTITNNKQAEKTQIWQTKFFIDFSDQKINQTEKINKILNH